jgi:hypothetical protein
MTLAGITDAGLVHLAGLTGLRWLRLADTAMSEAGIVHLEKLINLPFLDVSRTKADDFVAQDVRRALPKAKVLFTPLMAL